MYGPAAVRYNGTTAPNHRELMAFYQAAFNERLAAGDIKPVIFPYHTLGSVLLLIYLSIPHVNRPWLYALRWPVLAAIVAFNMKIILETRSLYFGSGFGVGLVSSMGIMYSMTWLVWNDPQFSAKRVEQVPDSSIAGTRAAEDESRKIAGGQVHGGNGKVLKSADALRRRDGLRTGNSNTNGSSNSNLLTNLTIKEDIQENLPKYHWQGYPLSSLPSRLSWLMDLLTSFRGTGWNWEIPTNPSLPASVLSRLGQPIDLASMSLTSPKSGIKRPHSRAEIIRHHVPRFVVGYLFLDAMRTFLPSDLYFLLGPEAASEFPPPAILEGWSALWIQLYRNIVSCVAIIMALENIFRLAPLIFSLVLGNRFLGVRGEAWHYPGTWGSFSFVQSHGLAGFWSRWWHQTFRFAFSSPTAFLVRHGVLPSATHPATKIVGLLFAFTLSGFLHAAGSYTQIAATRPWEPFCFFMLQALGIIIQTTFCHVCRVYIERLPQEVRKSANTAFVGTWLFYTAPLLVDDFARGGLWLYQVVPVSLFRGLGYGVPGDGWWCWGPVGGNDMAGMGMAPWQSVLPGLGALWWKSSGRWWDSGVALM